MARESFSRDLALHSFGCIQMHSDTLGCVQMHSDAIRNFGNVLEDLGKHLYTFDNSERFRKFSEVFGRVRMHSDAFGNFSKCCFFFGLEHEFFVIFSSFEWTSKSTSA